jgi:beta-lactamase class A
MSARHWRRRAVRLASVLGLLLPAAACAQRSPATAGGSRATPAFSRADTIALRRTLDSLAGAHRGIVGYTVLNLDTGERLARRGDEPFPTASLIKVPILVTVYRLVAQDSLSLDDPVTMLELDQVGGARGRAPARARHRARS